MFIVSVIILLCTKMRVKCLHFILKNILNVTIINSMKEIFFLISTSKRYYSQKNEIFLIFT